MNAYLERVILTKPISAVLTEIIRTYHLGNMITFQFFERGYEDLNIKVETNTGIYVIKIFSKGRTKAFIDDYVKTLIKFSDAAIRVPKLYLHEHHLLYEIPDNTTPAYACVMEYFEGKTLYETSATNDDVATIAAALGKIHTLSFPIHDNYDSWGLTNIVEEFSKNNQYLRSREYPYVQAIAKEFASTNFSHFHQSVIHGDIQKQHILKNDQNILCIIDLGCIAYNASAFDIANFLAHFCIDYDSQKEFDSILSLVVKEYSKFSHISKEEIQTLPLLIRTHFATYLLKSSFLVYGQNDTSIETREWLKFSRKGLKLFKNVNL